MEITVQKNNKTKTAELDLTEEYRQHLEYMSGYRLVATIDKTFDEIEEGGLWRLYQKN